MRRAAAVVTLTAAATLGALALAGSANAGSVNSAAHVGHISRTTTSYQYPTNQSAPVHFGLKPGQPVNIVCFTEGQVIHGNPYWFRIGQNGNLGFVHRDYIAPGVGMPHC